MQSGARAQRPLAARWITDRLQSGGRTARPARSNPRRRAYQPSISAGVRSGRGIAASEIRDEPLTILFVQVFGRERQCES